MTAVEKAIEEHHRELYHQACHGGTHSRANEIINNLITAVRADEKALVNERWQCVWDAEARKAEVWAAKKVHETIASERSRFKELTERLKKGREYMPYSVAEIIKEIEQLLTETKETL